MTDARAASAGRPKDARAASAGRPKEAVPPLDDGEVVVDEPGEPRAAAG